MVAEDGRVFSKHSNKFLKPHIGERGYCHVIIFNNGNGKKTYIHRLVAECYIGKANDKHVNHKDLNKLNNHFTNLEYCTQKENHKHGTRNAANIKKLDEPKVRKIRQLESKGLTQKEIGIMFGVSRQNILGVLKGKYYKWVK